MTRFRWTTLLVIVAAALPLVAADPASEIEMLHASVESLGAQHVLRAGEVRSLVVKLTHAGDALRQADAKRAMTQLHAFEREARGLVASGKLTQKSGLVLVDGATAARLTIERLAFTVPRMSFDLPQPCAVREPCERTVVWVDARARRGGSGAAGSPVATIAEALAVAQQVGACGAELRLAPGRYEEDVHVPLDLRIAGEGTGVVLVGSIVNRGGWDLDVDRITLLSSRWPGAVVVDSHCESRTEIFRVTIDGASGAGIFQRGGTIRIGLTTIRGTEAVAADPHSGTGLRLTGGAKGVLGLVGIEENATGGILAAGADTALYAAGVVVARNEVTPFAEPLPDGVVPQAPGIDVRDGALLLMQFSVVRDNDLYGLLLRNGARGHVRYSTIDRTRSLPDEHLYEWLADANASVHASTLELGSYTLSHALVGMILLDARGFGSRGLIAHHAIGMGVFFSTPPPGDPVTDLVRCMTDRTPFLHNDRNLDATTVPLPPTDIPGDDPPPPPPPCDRVPFDCTWCGAG